MKRTGDSEIAQHRPIFCVARNMCHVVKSYGVVVYDNYHVNLTSVLLLCLD